MKSIAFLKSAAKAACSLAIVAAAALSFASCKKEPSNQNLINEHEAVDNEHEAVDLVNGHEAVDLGLPSGLKWATCNVGADTPEDYGDYFAWGETKTKEVYDRSSYIYYAKDGTPKKYGSIDGNMVLEMEDDAARANWGSTWRMPTKEELLELQNECSWEWDDSKNGYIVIGPSKKSIFLPAAGYCAEGLYGYPGKRGYYQSSSLDEADNSKSGYLYFNSSKHYMSSYDRSVGNSVRPVTE